MDKINKFLLRLSKEDRQLFAKIFKDILDLSLDKYDVKPLKGLKDVFRLRKGNIRVVFIRQKEKVAIININFRKDVYKDL